MASNYCYDTAMVRAVERHVANEAVVIPVIVRACDWQGAPFGKLLSLPKEAEPITSWANRDEAWLNVVQDLRAAIAKLRNKYESSTRSIIALPHKMPRRMLPYLCNRNEQEDILEGCLRRHQQERKQRPIICLIHGDEREEHGSFLERLQLLALPKILNLEARQVSVRECILAPPPPLAKPHAFWQRLGDALLQYSGATPEEIFAEATNDERPLMVSLHLLTETLEKNGEALLANLLEFWNQWPDLPAGRMVIICVCLKYERCDDARL